MSGYESSHALSEEFTSAQKDKAISGFRRDYSTDSLVKYNSAFDSGKKKTGEKEPISPYNSEAKLPLKQKKVSYDINVHDTSVNQNLAKKYYNNERIFKKPSTGYSTEELVSNKSGLKENQGMKIHESNQSDRYKRDYKRTGQDSSTNSNKIIKPQPMKEEHSVPVSPASKSLVNSNFCRILNLF